MVLLILAVIDAQAQLLFLQNVNEVKIILVLKGVCGEIK